MKKILFATTALIATASVAAAEVRLSGYGRFGLDYNDANARTGLNGQNGAANGVSETNLTTRMRIQFDMSTETDGGVEFGGRVRLQGESRDGTVAGGAANGTTTANGARFYASYGGFTLQVGNIAGAIDSMPGFYLPTSSADTGIDGMGFNSVVVPFQFDAYSSGGTGANGMEVMYSSGDFAAHVSYSTTNGAVGRDRIAAWVKYSFGDWTAAVGMQDSDVVATAAVTGEDFVVVTIAGNLGQFGVGAAFASNADLQGLNNDVDSVRVYGSMDIGSAGNIVLWVNSSSGLANTGADGTDFGVNYKQDLGGGVSFDAGIVQSDVGGGQDQTQLQAGVYFRF